jgi:putative DNA methylase
LTENLFLIDSWFPFGETSVESIRERSAFTALPPLYAMHVWFSRKPLTASRITILCSLLQNKDKNNIFKIMGFPLDKDIVSVKKEIDELNARGIRKKENPYTWDRAFKHTPTDSELEWLHTELKKVWGEKLPTVMDPMAGGGSIAFEAMRLGLPVIASDLNPVAFLIQKAVLEYPAKFGEKLIPIVEEFCNEVHKRAYDELKGFFPEYKNEKIRGYVWARTIKCEKCDLKIPLSHHWWIVRTGKENQKVAVKLKIPKESEGDICSFEVIKNPEKEGYDPSQGTDVGKDGFCPRCPRTISGDFLKKEAQEGRMGHQLFCVCTKVPKNSRSQEWSFRSPTEEEINVSTKIEKILESKLKVWQKQGIVPEQDFPESNNDTRPLQYGMNKWVDMFNPRQLLSHLTYLEKIHEVKKEWTKNKERIEFINAVTTYATIIFNSCLDYNSIFTLWDSTRIKVAHTMGLQGFPFKTSYAEFDHAKMLWPWALNKNQKVLNGIVKSLPQKKNIPKIVNSDSSSLNLESKSVEFIIVDPPYGNNVLYGDVMDFFYVWDKKIIGDIFSDVFKNKLSNKDDEAVVNSSLYQDAGSGQAKKLAMQHFQSKLEACFKEMNRILKDEGVITVMFTHRKSEAWSGLTRALMNAGFTFKSSWAVATEPGQKFGKRDKGGLKRTVLLACKKRTTEKKGLWSKVKEELFVEAQLKVKEYSDAGITGPDLLVCTYGPVLGKFGDYSLIKDSAGNTKGPEDALELVAEAVNKFTVDVPGADIETMAYVNLITSFSESTIDEDDARVTVMFGGNLSISDLVDKGLVKKKGSKVTILTSKERLAAGTIDLAKPENLKLLIDTVHACLVTFDKLGIKAVKKLLEETGKDSSDSGFIATLKAISSMSFDVSGKSAMSDEIKTVKSLSDALGLEPESVLKKGEKITHYPKEASLDDF